MLSIKVNLLPRRGGREILRQRLFANLRSGSVYVLVGYMVLLIVLFGVRMAISSRKNSLEDQIRQARVRVDAFSSTESQQMLLKSKLHVAAGVLQRRKDWSAFLGEVLTFVPDEGSIGEITLNETGDLHVGVRTERLQEMALMLKALVQLGLVHEQVKTVSLSEVQKKSDGTYAFAVVIGTKK